MFHVVEQTVNRICRWQRLENITQVKVEDENNEETMIVEDEKIEGVLESP
jgi:hypothetical protein